MVTKDASGKKTVYPHGIMNSTAKWALEVAESIEEGSFYQSLVCCLATAFTLEAYFNFLGDQLYADWDTVYERTPPKDRLKILAKRVGYVLDHNSPEYDAFTRVFALRKALVHGKVEVESGSWNTKEKGKSSVMALQTDWERLGTPEAAKSIYDRCVSIVNGLHAASQLPGQPFGSSMYGMSHILTANRNSQPAQVESMADNQENSADTAKPVDLVTSPSRTMSTIDSPVAGLTWALSITLSLIGSSSYLSLVLIALFFAFVHFYMIAKIVTRGHSWLRYLWLLLTVPLVAATLDNFARLVGILGDPNVRLLL